MAQKAGKQEKNQIRKRVRSSPRTNRHSSSNSKYMTDSDLAERWTVSRDTVWRWSKIGKTPSPIKLGDNCTRWLRSRIEEWEAAQECGE
ncbi:MAG: hypothetical protein DRR42_23200 [Gammaproteobacteria bacterium]|nr:MAG: hypothetical protein DRR42_23200 [Gammaproteobacteria bacterium]